MGAHLIGLGAIGLVAFGLGGVAFILARNPIAERPTLGSRGLRRQQALEEGGFKLIELPVRVVGGWFAQLPLDRLRANISKQLVYAGDYLGLSADDFLGLTVVSGVLSTLGALLLANLADLTNILVVFAVFLGFYLPWLSVKGEAQMRFKSVNRSLPTSIDLAALCMGAGLDFPGALRQIVEKSSTNDAVLVGELNRILQELELGHTRRKALEGLAERVPTEAVRDFVGTVVQAEEKGNPLAEVLTIQARMLRMRRSVMAEEAAAKAGVMMMGPLMMIFVCIILLLLGPFVVKWMTTGF